MDTIKVWVDDTQPSGTVKNALPSFARAAVARSMEVSRQSLHESIRDFAAQFADLLDGQSLNSGKVVMEEIELSLAVNASGGVELLGKLNVGAEASVKVKLKRMA